MAKRPVVVISSTALDLPEHRREVMAACLSLDCVPKMMEHLPAVDADAIQASLALVDQADIYIGVFAYRYGYIPEDHAISITEMELRRAEERHLPCLIFLIHEDHPVTGKDFETGIGAEKLESLKARLGSDRVAAFFRSPADLRAKVLQSLVALRDKLRDETREDTGSGPTTGDEVDRPPPSIENNPYRSLSAFQEEDAPVFYGRDALIRETLATFYGLIDPKGTAQVRLFAILGPSGSGKSSFARAGLAAQLNRKARDHQTDLRVFTFIPGEHPMAALTGLIRIVFGGEPSPPSQAAEEADHDNERKEPFPSPLTSLPAGGPSWLVLLVDQFEEVYSLCGNEGEQNAFVNALVTAASAPQGRISVILTMRSDFLGETQRHAKLNTAIAQHALIVPALSAEDLRFAITEPAKRAGHPIDEKTVGRLIDQTIGREGVLPLLQFVLSAIWQGMATGITPADTLTKLGGVGGALASHAEDLYQALTEQDQQIARRAFLGMVQLGEGAQDTRRRVPVAKLVASDNADQVREVLDRFAQPGRRLVTLSSEADQPVAEVTHEALFSHWGTLQRWLGEGRDDIRFQRRLEEAVDEWQEKNKPPGLLWRPPLLSLLRGYHKKHSGDMRKEDLAFYQASEEAHQREIDREQARTKLLRNVAIAMGIVAAVAAGVGGFFAFATVHGLDPGEAVTALKIRAGLKSIPVPEMIPIRPGEGEFPASFLMSSGRLDIDFGRSTHLVTIKKPFAIGRHEVTFAQYAAFVKGTTGAKHPDDEGWGRADRPVINVSWDDAQAYAKWLSTVTGEQYRLPTESEWEYAARACKRSEPECLTWDYWWGNDVDKDGRFWANCKGCNATWDGKDEGSRTAAVNDGAFEPNGFGLYHTAGNVWEWVEDCWHVDDSGASRPNVGEAWLEGDGGDCGRRVLRGGSWVDGPGALRSALRSGFFTGDRVDYLGFRLAQDL